MGKVEYGTESDIDFEEVNETAKFNTKAHFRVFNSIFQLFVQTFHKWFSALIPITQPSPLHGMLFQEAFP